MWGNIVDGKTCLIAASIFGILVTSSNPGSAQTNAVVPSETVSGVARDALQRPLDSVQIRLETPDGRVIARGATQKDGKYTLPAVAPGVYSLIGERTGFTSATAVVTVGANAVASDLTLASNQALDLKVAAQRLAAARSEVQPRIGATTYTLDQNAIQDQPGGSNIPLNQTLLQAPDISQDSFGQIHLRNDHANIQYRIDGVALPEGISFFGQSLSSRFASSIDLITGSLPAQYGLVTTGIVDIQTKSGTFEPGGSVGFYGGSHGWMEPSGEYAGSLGNVNYYVSGDLLENGIGIENPTNSTNPVHDQTRQGHGFAYFEDIIDPTSKISLILGAYQGSFQIPDNPGQTPAFQLGNKMSFNSALLDETQQESNDYAALSYLKTEDNYSVQISGFVRYSSLAFRPDDVGDLIFNGIAQDAKRTDVAQGLQVDASYKLTDSHTLRYGGLITAERATSNTSSLVFPCFNLSCTSVGTTPLSISDSSAITGWTYSAYAQDEWKLLPTVTINYGARFDVLNAFTDTNQLSPRVNVVWTPTPNTSLHAGYSRYFTPPSLELISGETITKFAGTTGFPAGYTPASPPQDGAILPERSNYFDIGADHTFGPGLKLGVDGFYKLAQDLIDEGQFGAPIILSVFNYAHANVFGVEFTGSYKRGDFSAYGNLSVGREKATQVASQQFNFTPAQLAFIASNYIYTDHSQWVTASGGVAYTWLGTRFSGDFLFGSGLRQDQGDVPNGGTVSPYTQINLSVTHRFEDVPGGPIELSLNVINAVDETYEIRSGSGVGVFAPQFGPRRAFYAGIRKFF
jgi:outer membrane receptor protein involved in Fe transport